MIQLRRPALAICAVLLAVSTAGCNSTPSAAPSPLSDPSAILSGSFAALGSATSLHLDGTLDGTVNASSLGFLTGGSMPLSGPIKIDGTKISGDVNLSKQAFDVSLALPSSLFGFKGEAILVDGYTYTMFELFGPKFTRTAVSSSALASGATAQPTPDVAGMLRAMPLLLELSGTTSRLVGMEAVDGTDAYHLTLDVPAGLVNQALGAIGGAAASSLAPEATTVDYWVYRDGLRPARLQAKATSAKLGTVDLSVTMSQYDKPVTIQAPPDSQDQTG